MLYATVSKGAPGDRHVTPVLASSDPEIVRRVVQVFAEILTKDADTSERGSNGGTST